MRRVLPIDVADKDREIEEQSKFIGMLFKPITRLGTCWREWPIRYIHPKNHMKIPGPWDRAVGACGPRQSGPGRSQANAWWILCCRSRRPSGWETAGDWDNLSVWTSTPVHWCD